MNFRANFEKLFQISVNTTKKTGKVFKHLFSMPDLDVCGFMSGAIKNPLFKALIDQVKSEVKIFHECPYTGTVAIKNLDVTDDKFFMIYPAGVYRYYVTISRQRDKVDLVSMTLTTTIKMNP